MPVEQYRAPCLAKQNGPFLVTLYSQKEDNEASSHASELNLPRSTNLSIVGFKNGRFLFIMASMAGTAGLDGTGHWSLGPQAKTGTVPSGQRLGLDGTEDSTPELMARAGPGVPR